MRVQRPRALIHFTTGAGLLPARLQQGSAVLLAQADGCPPAWQASRLHHGVLRGLPAWLLEELAVDETPPGPEPAWNSGFPAWLAAGAGASTLVHVSAGISTGSLAPGSMALLADHLNLSGASPLAGLGESRLGPLFPDLSRLHDRALRRGALERCARLGLAGAEAVGACTLGPALDTPAELSFYARAGADVAVQGLAGPLLAAAHAGLRVLAVVAVVARADAPSDVASLAAAANAMAPALDDLVWELAHMLASEPSSALEER